MNPALEIAATMLTATVVTFAVLVALWWTGTVAVANAQATLRRRRGGRHAHVDTHALAANALTQARAAVAWAVIASRELERVRNLRASASAPVNDRWHEAINAAARDGQAHVAHADPIDWLTAPYERVLAESPTGQIGAGQQ